MSHVRDTPLALLLTLLKQDYPEDLLRVLMVLTLSNRELRNSYLPTSVVSHEDSRQEISLVAGEYLTAETRRDWVRRYALYRLFSEREDAYTNFGKCFIDDKVNWFETVHFLRVPLKIDRNRMIGMIEISNQVESGSFLNWFVRLIGESDESFLNKLLQFWTGSPNLIDSDEITFKVTVFGHDRRLLPVSHTCVYGLDMPPYENYEEFRERLTLSVNEGVGFSLS